MGSKAYYSQIIAQPKAIEAALARTNAPKLDANKPIIFTGVGSSLHACMTASLWASEITEGKVRPTVIDALELVLAGGVRTGDQLIVVSHRGNKRFTNELIAQAKEVGASTVLVTGDGVENPAGDVVLRTSPDDAASAHTISYTTALAVLGKLVSTLGGSRAEELEQALNLVPEAVQKTLDLPEASNVADRLAGVEPVLIAGSGIDAATAEEIALKHKESTFLWAEAIGVELALHGTPAGFRPNMAGIIIRPEHNDGGRAKELGEFLRTLGSPVFEVAAGDGDIPFAPVPRLVRPLVSVVALQRLVGAVADRVDGDPDATREGVEPWTTAISRVKL